MKKAADMVIIGGGIIGLSIAYYLGKLGAKHVLLFEKNQIGSGSTGFCLGGIRRIWSTEINLQFSIKSFEIFQNFEDEFGFNPEFRQEGYLFLATSQEELEFFKKNNELQTRLGVPSEILTREEIEKAWPFLKTDDVHGAAFCGTDGYLGPHEVTYAMFKGAKRYGVQVFQGNEVTSIEVKKNRVVSVTTCEGRVETPIVVNAAGPYARNVGKMAGVEIPVNPIRRQIHVTEPFEKIPPSIPLTVDIGQSFYFRKEGPSVLLCGHEDKEPSFNLSTDFASMVEAAEKGVYRAPVLEETKIMRSWAGLYCLSPDKHAILGKVPEVEGLILANGFSGHGFQHGPAVGLVIAELILYGRAKTIDIDPLGYVRVKEGKWIEEPMAVN
ncbi:MAG: FAD-binding oxidoreductase [Pseudomonadota bacterium]